MPSAKHFLFIQRDDFLRVMDEKLIVYLILGAGGSGRREIARDLAAFGLAKDARPLILVSENERAPGSAVKSAPAASARLLTWRWDDNRIVADVPEGTTHIFFVVDGRGDPIDHVEAIQKWIHARNADLGRVITVVHAKLLHDNPPLMAWHKACIHFSDIVLMTRRDDVPQKWISDFIARFREEHYPCLFEFVSNGAVKNPALILSPDPRRISLLFDELPDLDEKAAAEEDEEPQVDPYIARTISGRRIMELPDIREYID